MPKLSDTKIRAAKPRQKPYKLFDSDGLFLSVQPNGGRWRQRYYLEGKEQLLSLGTYPEITPAEAREKGAIIRKQVAHGANPSAERQQKKIARREASASTYKAVALEWLEETAKARQWSVDHSQRTMRRLEVHFFPWLGPKPIADVTDDDVMACLRRMEDRNLLDTAHRALSENDSLFRYAKNRKYVKRANPWGRVAIGFGAMNLAARQPVVTKETREFLLTLLDLSTNPESKRISFIDLKRRIAIDS